MNRLIAVVVLGAELGCGGGSSGSAAGAPSNQALTGTIEGKPWTFHTAESNAFLSDDKNLRVDAYAASFTPCTNAGPFDSDRLILTVPRTIGTHPLSLSLNETFYSAASSTNLVATRGTIVVDSVTDTTITGSLKFAYNADNSADGVRPRPPPRGGSDVGRILRHR
jgi:hypothetical protein